jgi:PAS domain-containing protein
LDAAFAASGRAGASYSAEYRLAPVSRNAHAGQERWVTVEGTVVRDAEGQAVRLLGVTRDITHRKQAAQALAERDAQLAIAGKIALIGSFTFDIGSGKMQVSPGYAAIHDLPEGIVETSRTDWRARVHLDDLPRLDANQRDIDGRRSEHTCEYGIACPPVRSDGSRPAVISYDRTVPYNVLSALTSTSQSASKPSWPWRNAPCSSRLR